jgi:hypothetical protein
VTRDRRVNKDPVLHCCNLQTLSREWTTSILTLMQVSKWYDSRIAVRLGVWLTAYDQRHQHRPCRKCTWVAMRIKEWSIQEYGNLAGKLVTALLLILTGIMWNDVGDIPQNRLLL